VASRCRVLTIVWPHPRGQIADVKLLPPMGV